MSKARIAAALRRAGRQRSIDTTVARPARLFNRMLGQLYFCLHTGQHYQQHRPCSVIGALTAVPGSLREPLRREHVSMPVTER